MTVSSSRGSILPSAARATCWATASRAPRAAGSRGSRATPISSAWRPTWPARFSPGTRGSSGRPTWRSRPGPCSATPRRRRCFGWGRTQRRNDAKREAGGMPPLAGSGANTYYHAVPERPAPRPVTARDVAARAGVSKPTVSLVLGGHPTARLSAATRARVQRAARELGYRPNLAARGLARGRSYAIGLLVPDLRNPFFADVAGGPQRGAAEEGYALLLAEAREIEPGRHLEALRARQIDGIIVDAVGAADLDPGLLAGLNVVLIDEPSTRWPGV